MKLKEIMSDIRRNNELVKQGGAIGLGILECQREGIKLNAKDYFNKVLSRAQDVSTFIAKHRNEDFETVLKNAEWQRYLKRRYLKKKKLDKLNNK